MNPILSNHEWEDHYIRLYKANYDLLEKALVIKGYLANRYSILKPLCQTDRVETEERKSCWVDFYLNALALNINLATVFDISAC